MKHKKGKGIKLFFALMAVMGGGFALSSCCGNDRTNDQIVEPDTPTIPDVPDTPDTPDVPDTPDTPDTPTENREDKLNLVNDIQNLLAYKINDRVEYDLVSNVDVSYFTIRDSFMYGKMLETVGEVEFAETEQIADVTLGVPLTNDQYDVLHNLNFMSYEVQGDVVDKYTLEALQTVDDIMQNKDLTFNYATLNNEQWDFQYENSVYLEHQIEQKFTDEFNDYIKNVLHGQDVCTINFSYLTIENSDRLGYLLKFTGTATNQNNKTLSYEIALSISEQDYNALMQSFDNSNINQTANLCDNYSRDFLLNLTNVISHESTITYRYTLNGLGYIVNDIENRMIF